MRNCEHCYQQQRSSITIKLNLLKFRIAVAKRWKTQLCYCRMKEVSLGYVKSGTANSELTSKKLCPYPTTWLCNQNFLLLCYVIRVYHLISLWFWFIKCLFWHLVLLSIEVPSVNPKTWLSSDIINLPHLYVLSSAADRTVKKQEREVCQLPTCPYPNNQRRTEKRKQWAVPFKDVKNKPLSPANHINFCYFSCRNLLMELCSLIPGM